MAQIPPAERRALVRAREHLRRAEASFEQAVRDALAAGGSYSAVAETADLARSTVQKIVQA